jgi:hypothetical protein
MDDFHGSAVLMHTLAQLMALLFRQSQVCFNVFCGVLANSHRCCPLVHSFHAVMDDFQGSAVLMHTSALALLPSQAQVSDNHLASCYLAGQGAWCKPTLLCQ